VRIVLVIVALVVLIGALVIARPGQDLHARMKKVRAAKAKKRKAQEVTLDHDERQN
jgi:hypothetical protein